MLEFIIILLLLLQKVKAVCICESERNSKTNSIVLLQYQSQTFKVKTLKRIHTRFSWQRRDKVSSLGYYHHHTNQIYFTPFSPNCLWDWICFRLQAKIPNTGKSLSEALLLAEHGESMLCAKIVLNVRNNFCKQHVLPRFELGIFMY